MGNHRLGVLTNAIFLVIFLVCVFIPRSAFTGEDRLIDMGGGNWINTFYLPDSYLPEGFIYDPKGRHFIFNPVDPGCDQAYCQRYFIGSHAACANVPLSPNPLDPNTVVGYGDNPPRFEPRSIGSMRGYWNLGYVSLDDHQSTFVFKIGSCVVNLRLSASQAMAEHNHKFKFPRPTEQEIFTTYEKFFKAFQSYISDRAWMDLQGKSAIAINDVPQTDHTHGVSGSPGNNSFPEDKTFEAEVPPSVYDTYSPDNKSISPVTVAAGTLAAGGIAGLGAWLMLGQAGVGRREMLDAVGDLARGQMPSDGFDDWKAKYEGLGWTYREQDGVAIFDPPPGYTEHATAAPPVIERYRDGETNADTGEVWSDEDGGWIGRNLYDQEKRRTGEIASIEERNRQAVANWDAETQALDSAIASSQRDRAARAKAEEAARVRIGNKLTQLFEEDGISTEEVERLRRERDTVGLETLYENTWRDRMAKTTVEAATHNRHAGYYRTGELVSKAVLAGSKAGMMVITGPAGYIPALVGSGVLRSAEEGATAYVKSDGDKRALGTALVSGFFAGAKDGVVGRFTGLARTGNATKILLPAGADAGETFIRTGDIKATVTSGLMSAAGGAAGTRMDGLGNAIAREAGQAATGATIGAAGAAINGGDITEGAVNGLVDAVGGRMGQHIATNNTPMTRAEIRMDLEYKAKLADAHNRIDALDKAVTSGDPTKIKPALQDVLEHREAKVLMKGQDVDPALKSSFSELTQEHRTKPVMDGTADALNRQTVTGPDGTEQPRFVIKGDDGVERSITGSDFASGSGKPGEPGVDLDMYPKGTIIDKATRRPAKGIDVDQAVSESCTKLGIDRQSQEVNVTGMKGTEDLTMRPGETPEQFYARVARERTVSAAEGTGAAEVATHKLHAADDLHGDGEGSSALAEKTRGMMKDKKRLIDPLIAGDGKAQIPEVFRRMEPIKRKSAMEVLQNLADGKMAPGTANAKFRQLTSMNIDQALPKMAGWSEGMGKWGGGSPGGMPAGPSFTGSGGANNLQRAAATILRDMKKAGSE